MTPDDILGQIISPLKRQGCHSVVGCTPGVVGQH
jgi:hypothetical protein